MRAVLGRRGWLGTVLVAVVCVAGQAATAPAAPPPAPAARSGPTVQHACAHADKAGYASCFALRRTDSAARPQATTPNATPPGYGPASLQSAYQLPSAASGSGQTVAIVDAFDDPNATTDLATYRQQYGLQPCTEASGCFRKVDQRGATNYPLPRPDWSEEISLDLDMVSAACPNCHILLVEADDNSLENLGTAVNEAVALGARFVSNSYGSSEDPAETGWDTSYYQHAGAVITASTGDFGYGVEYPASSPYVTAVGGTSLTPDAGSARGWTETAWSGAGSGCSAYETKPEWQHDPGCSFKAEADVSAVADPATGVAVYDSYQAGGWGVFGGTSASAPLIAATYALAGPPVAGTDPASYPYADTAALNDVTDGSNGTCDPAYLCTAGSGYDGPTGLGTPAGVGAFAMVAHGTVAGTVTDAATGKPVAGVAIDIDQQSTTSDTAGQYSLAVPVGTSDLTATKFGYATKTVPGVAVTTDATTALDIALTAEPIATVSGTVTDGSAHQWPLAATVSVPGTPAVATTDPATGHYSLTVLQGHQYTLHVDAHYPGYRAVDQQVTTDGATLQQDFAVRVDASTCSAPGYRFDYAGSTETFDSADGWTVANNAGTGGWKFTDPNRPNTTGGSGGFATADSLYDGQEDTELVSPVVDLSGASTPIVQFDTDLQGAWNSTSGIDLSVDGGTTWTNVWENDGWPGLPGPQRVVVPLPQAVGKAQAQVRFHYTGDYSDWWELDNVFVGNRSCDPMPGGLAVGHVTDENTGKGVGGATVGDATSEPDGFYALFSPSGSQSISASMTHYVSVQHTVNVAADWATTADFVLPAGQLAVSRTSVAVTTRMGTTTTATVKITNTGTAPATASLSEEPGGFVQQAAGAPKRLVQGTFSLGSHARYAGAARTTPAAATPADPPWTPIADYPTRIMDQSMVTDPDTGRVYSIGGFDGSTDTTRGYVYDPASQAWTPIAPMHYAREHASAAWINGRIYVTGGWDSTGGTVAQTEVYDPATNSWSSAAEVPTPLAASGVAVYNARLYVIGGCDPVNCGHTNVQVYDPAADSWSTAAPYAEPTSWLACGTLYGQIDCAGGQTTTGETTDAFGYDPSANRWSRIAPLPIDMAAMSYAVADNHLLVVGGTTQHLMYLTNQGFSYDPDTNEWTALPNANYTVYRAASACGLYTVGGSIGGITPVVNGEQLPGYGQCAGNFDVGWLSESTTTVTLAPGKSATITLTFDASDASVSQPGTYNAELGARTDTPYAQPPIAAMLTATPPKTWGEVAGTVLGANCDGTTSPIGGAVVEVDTWAASYALVTDASGHYGLWLDRRNNPLTLIAAANGWQPQTATVRIAALKVTTRNFTLEPLRACS